jgi:cell division protein FtsQ
MIEAGWLDRLGRRGPRRRSGGLLTRDAEPPEARASWDRGPRPRRLRIPRPGVRIAAVIAAVLVLAGGVWLWLRDSSLVAVKHVTVTGASGPDAARIRSALDAAARNMTTLDVHMDTLNTVVEPFPVVKGLDVSTQFPHGMRIRVIEEVPVGAITFDGRRIAVAADDTLLHDVRASPTLASIPMRVAPGGTRVSGATGQAVRVLSAAPAQLRSHVSEVTSTSTAGLVAQLRHGPSIYFGNDEHLRQKWAAAAAVLADSGSVGALYIDVTDPNRPAAGSNASAPSAAGSGATSSGSAGSTSTSASGSGTSSTASGGG